MLGAEEAAKEGLIKQEKPGDIEVRVQGRPVKSDTDYKIYFEAFHDVGTALNHSEIVLLPDEVPGFTLAL
ncbi:hypothetical protein FZC79_00385 [Rossellomorea vietnamensis]|uniref:Uncharacterized protein n=2 Tax=Rossellomorea TaxID=2837508 RepID=A0A5D4KK79_9BACI|nr:MULTISPECIES: hypothetical protein [Rossellomorea]TYR77316.1 hypothetical protein FZC79_00385 [Rossellomorea vietnamensis]TYS78152.1 hypothetical protein FZC80_13035 [Rossellomorea aquimaris]